MSKRVYTVGIAGASCSGKTSVAAGLAARVGRAEGDDAALGSAIWGAAGVLGLDAYYRDFSGVPDDQIEVDVPDAIDRSLLFRHVSDLQAGGPVEIPVYDYQMHSRAPGGRPVEAPEILVVEGLFTLYWKELRDRLDLAVFIEVDRETALARRLERDVRERGRTPASVRRQFDAKVVPNFERFVSPSRRWARLVLDGCAPLAESIATLERTVRKGHAA